MTKNISYIGEFGLIDLIRRNSSSTSRVIYGIGDDTAVVSAPNKGYVSLLTTDMLVEDVHFTKKMPAFWVGHKAMGCNISDIAAMGGIPKFALVSLGVDRNVPIKYVSDVYRGMEKLAKAFGVSIVGGDTVRSRKIIINVALMGEAKKQNVVTRSGAKVGDQIFVTGRLGGSFKSGRHLRFTPRVAESQFLAAFKPTAMIDISDGLAADLGHILEESRVGAVIDEKAIPKHRNVTVNQALHDGEDFELVFTLSPKDAQRLEHQRQFKFYRIGEIVSKSKGYKILSIRGEITNVNPKGFQHF